MYVEPNFHTKKALKVAVEGGASVHVFSPGPFPCPQNGEVSVEGPHYPEPHRWYARVQVLNGRVMKVVG